MVFRFLAYRLIPCLAVAASLAACGGGSGGSGEKSPSNGGVQSLALPASAELDTSWLMSRSATQALLPTALPDSFVKGAGWALATRTDVASASSYTANFSGRGWYVDPDQGDDSGPGTQARPWRTLQRASAGSYAAGDAVLLRCGKTFRDSLDLTSAAVPAGRLLIAAYGDCTANKRPIVKGSDLIASTGWSKVGAGSDQTHVHDWAPAPDRLFFNGLPMLKARHPNTQGVGQEFAKLKADGTLRNRFYLSDADRVALASQDLVGATVYVRVAAYEIESATITAHDTGTGLLTLNRSLDHAIKDDAGYILEGKRWMLDSAGEWWHDSGAGKLYAWGPNGEHASAFTQVESSTRNIGVRLRWIDDVSIEWIQTEQHSDAGFHLTETDGLRVSGIHSRFDQTYGIQVLSSHDVRVEESIVHAAGWVGIAVREGSQVAVERNRVSDTGLFDRAGSTDASISVLSAAANITDNVVYRSSHHGLRFRNNPGNLVNNNLVVASCVRLTDCGGIYTFTASHPTAPAVAYAQAATVSNNIVIGARSNREGLGTGGNNMTAGIFLDELTAGAHISNNFVVDTEAGIQMHDAAYNVISGNQIRSVAYAGIRGMASRTDVAALKGNRVTGNSLGYFTSITELPGGESTGRDRAYAQFWYHPIDAQGLFQGAAPNISELNQTVGVQSQSEVRWRLAQSGTEWVLNASQWQALAPQDSHTAPLLHRNYQAITTGTSLVSNGNFQDGPSGWTHYLNPMGSGGAFQAGSLTDCPSGLTCGRWSPGMAGDFLTSAPFTLQSTSGQNLYLIQFTVTGGSGGSSTRALIRRRVSPYENYGLSVPDNAVAPGETVNVERFFRATGESDAVLDLRGAVGGQSLYRQVNLLKVSSVEMPEPNSLIGHLYNARTTPATFTCSMLSLGSCDVVDGGGQAVSWPITLPARASVSLYARDARWLRP